MKKIIPVTIHNPNGRCDITKEMVIELYPQGYGYKAAAFLERTPMNVTASFNNINDFDSGIKAFEERAIMAAEKSLKRTYITSPDAQIRKHGYI